MARSVNKVILIGRLGRDPELKYTASGTAYCRFSLATDDAWTDRSSGERQERTEWHNVIAWDKLAEICGQYLAKGRLVYIEGSIQSRQWEDQDGNKRTSFDIRARDMVMLSSAAGAAAGGAGSGSSAGSVPVESATDDDIPF